MPLEELMAAMTPAPSQRQRPGLVDMVSQIIAMMRQQQEFGLEQQKVGLSQQTENRLQGAQQFERTSMTPYQEAQLGLGKYKAGMDREELPLADKLKIADAVYKIKSDFRLNNPISKGETPEQYDERLQAEIQDYLKYVFPEGVLGGQSPAGPGQGGGQPGAFMSALRPTPRSPRAVPSGMQSPYQVRGGGMGRVRPELANKFKDW